MVGYMLRNVLREETRGSFIKCFQSEKKVKREGERRKRGSEALYRKSNIGKSLEFRNGYTMRRLLSLAMPTEVKLLEGLYFYL